MDNTKFIVLGGGCFWCTEAVFDQLNGVFSVESGYSGSTMPYPTYKQICAGTTGHAEVIKVTYNPEIISLEDLIAIHLNTHDPTTLNRQGADVGTQYRSIIFYQNEAEKELITKAVATAQAEFSNKIVTEIAPFDVFYKAEAYHQEYFKLNAYNPYCQAVIPPKLKKLREKYAQKLKA